MDKFHADPGEKDDREPEFLTLADVGKVNWEEVEAVEEEYSDYLDE
jgi:hypothetical protein